MGLYLIRHWLNQRSYCNWYVNAKEAADAQRICEELRQNCINAGWTPVATDILNPAATAAARHRERLRGEKLTSAAK